jgi:transcriptional regulator with XRE-family HTH domain
LRRVATQEETELGKARGEAFATWLRHALERKGWSARQLADNLECSHSNVSLYLRGGYDKQIAGYRRPKETFIDEAAAALTANPDEGRRAAGYQERGEATLLPDRIAQLPPEAIRALLNFLDALEGTGRVNVSPGSRR